VVAEPVERSPPCLTGQRLPGRLHLIPSLQGVPDRPSRVRPWNPFAAGGCRTS
jgi:hypothetical protein